MGGKKQFQAGYEYTDGTYDPNDLGFLQINNLVNFNLNTSYHEYEPFWHFNEYNFYLETNYTRLVDPSVFHNYNIYGETYAGFKIIYLPDYGLIWNLSPPTIILNHVYLEGSTPILLIIILEDGFPLITAKIRH